MSNNKYKAWGFPIKWSPACPPSVRILPASYPCAEPELDAPGVKVLMKSGKQFANVKRLLTEKGLSEHTSVVQNCGMPGEALYPTLSQTGDTAGYFSILIVKEL